MSNTPITQSTSFLYVLQKSPGRIEDGHERGEDRLERTEDREGNMDVEGF